MAPAARSGGEFFSPPPRCGMYDGSRGNGSRYPGRYHSWEKERRQKCTVCGKIKVLRCGALPSCHAPGVGYVTWSQDHIPNSCTRLADHDFPRISAAVTVTQTEHRMLYQTCPQAYKPTFPQLVVCTAMITFIQSEPSKKQKRNNFHPSKNQYPGRNDTGGCSPHYPSSSNQHCDPSRIYCTIKSPQQVAINQISPQRNMRQHQTHRSAMLGWFSLNHVLIKPYRLSFCRI